MAVFTLTSVVFLMGTIFFYSLALDNMVLDFFKVYLELFWVFDVEVFLLSKIHSMLFASLRLNFLLPPL